MLQHKFCNYRISSECAVIARHVSVQGNTDTCLHQLGFELVILVLVWALPSCMHCDEHALESYGSSSV